MYWHLALPIFIVYSVTLILTSSAILDPIRQWFILKTPWLYSPLAKLNKEYIYPAGTKHFCECRMCMGTWITILISYLYSLNVLEYFIVFGVSYFLATQER